MKIDRPLKVEMKDALKHLLLTFVKPLFVTFIIGNVLIFVGVIEKPSFLQWCAGTGSLLIGGGVFKAGKYFREKFIK
jgi:hypothetical protein